MPQDLPRPVLDALRVLVAQCVRAAGQSEDVRRSLETVGRFLTDSARDAQRGGSGAQHGVLTPAARKQAEPSRPRAAGDGARLTAPLATVVTRARWKAAACRLSVERAERTEGSDGTDPLESRESTLRARLKSLPDASTWMLDMPFGKRISDADALEVPPDGIERLETIANCYDAVATAAEVAIELDEAGAFDRGPAPSFLYLMAEAQSSLLLSLALAPTRVDSDQRDIFHWLKDQTTKYRIYVDRFMRLDDPADPSQATELVERIRRGAREVLADRKNARRRRELLSKVRYHAKKVREAAQPSTDEVESLAIALGAWRTAGFEAADRRVAEALAPLRVRVGGAEGCEATARLAELLGMRPDAGDVPRPEAAWNGAQEAPDTSDARDPVTLDELRSGLATRSIAILLDASGPADTSALESGIGGQRFDAVRVDLEAAPAMRTAAIDAFLATGADVFLLGVKLPSEEYASFKAACLEREVLFVRLPGPLETEAVLHQISRQVGWRLRARAQR